MYYFLSECDSHKPGTMHTSISGMGALGQC